MHAAHCMPIYRLGSLQYFTDVRAAHSATRLIDGNTNTTDRASVPDTEGSGTPGGSLPSTPGVSAAEGEGR